MTQRKRASGLVRGLVLQALTEAIAARGPPCFASQRAAAKEIAADLDISPSTVRRALSDPLNADLAAAILVAIRPCSPVSPGTTCQGVATAGFGSEPGGEPPVSHPVSQVSQGEPPSTPSVSPDASPLVSHGEPEVSQAGASRAREPRCSTSPAPLCPAPGPDSPAQPATDPAAATSSLSTTLRCYPRHVRPSRFPGECLFCGCPLDEGQGLILTPYIAEARTFCLDCADEGLLLAQMEWLLAGREVPKRRAPRKPKPDTNPTPEE